MISRFKTCRVYVGDGFPGGSLRKAVVGVVAACIIDMVSSGNGFGMDSGKRRKGEKEDTDKQDNRQWGF
jgi:hypothetical protein